MKQNDGLGHKGNPVVLGMKLLPFYILPSRPKHHQFLRFNYHCPYICVDMKIITNATFNNITYKILPYNPNKSNKYKAQA